MEFSQTFERKNLVVDDTTRSYFYETAKWARFLAIVGFIGASLILIAALFMILLGGTFFTQFPTEDGNSTPAWLFPFIGFLYFILGGFGFYISLLLYRFGEQMITALDNHQQEIFNGSLKNLRVMFRIYGIITIAYLTLLIVAFFVGIIGGFMG